MRAWLSGLRSVPALLVLWTLGSLLPTAAAQTACGEYFDRSPPANVVYALVFAADLDPTGVRKLQNEVSSALEDLARGVALPSGGPSPRIKLFVCQGSVGDDDLERAQVVSFFRARAVALFWRSRIGEREGLAQVAVPIFLKPDMASVGRDEVEFALSIPGEADGALQTWTRAFAPDSRAYRSSVYMGLAAHLSSLGQHRAAWYALCRSHGLLRDAGEQILRPSPGEVEARLMRHLLALMASAREAMSASERAALPPCASAQAQPGGAP